MRRRFAPRGLAPPNKVVRQFQCLNDRSRRLHTHGSISLLNDADDHVAAHSSPANRRGTGRRRRQALAIGARHAPRNQRRPGQARLSALMLPELPRADVTMPLPEECMLHLWPLRTKLQLRWNQGPAAAAAKQCRTPRAASTQQRRAAVYQVRRTGGAALQGTRAVGLPHRTSGHLGA